MPLPKASEGDDKEARGRVLIVGGSRETPGAVMLAGLAALRAGAGKLRIATVESLAAQVAASVPEARVYRLAETREGDISTKESARIRELANDVDSLCIGPGMIEKKYASELVKKLFARKVQCPVVLDANALTSLGKSRNLLRKLEGRVVVTPQAEEMSEILREKVENILEGRERAAREAAESLRAVVALKGRETFIVSADGRRAFVNRAGNAGLATSGSGDALAGLIAGLLARGADALSATLWGVHAHAIAGDRLLKKFGAQGFLAREIPFEIPFALARLSQGDSDV